MYDVCMCLIFFFFNGRTEVLYFLVYRISKSHKSVGRLARVTRVLNDAKVRPYAVEVRFCIEMARNVSLARLFPGDPNRAGLPE